MNYSFLRMMRMKMIEVEIVVMKIVHKICSYSFISLFGYTLKLLKIELIMDMYFRNRSIQKCLLSYRIGSGFICKYAVRSFLVTGTTIIRYQYDFKGTTCISQRTRS